MKEKKKSNIKDTFKIDLIVKPKKDVLTKENKES